MKRILVTGGCGFIFSNFIRYMLNKYPDYEIINLDALFYSGRLENTEDFKDNKRYHFIKGNICDISLVDKLMREVDYVINGAAQTHVDRSILDPYEFVRTDILGTHVLLEAVRKYKIKKFIQISTDEVYGSIEKGKFTEQSPLKPNSPYSASKTGADLLVRAYFKTFGLPVLITRSSNNYGAYQYPEKLIPLFITNLIEGKKVPVYGDGLNVRDWLYVLDNCEAIDIVLQKGELGEVYNIGADCEKTNKEITEIILKELGKDENWIEHVKDRPGHDKRYALDSSKIKKLGWNPKYSFEKAIKQTIDWYKNNQNWWKKIKSGEFLEYYKKQYKNL